MIIPLSVLLILVAGLLLVRFFDNETGTEEDSTGSVSQDEEETGLPRLTKEDIEQVTVTPREGNKHSIRRSEESSEEEILWEYLDENDSPSDMNLDQDLLTSAVSALVSYSETGNVPEGMEDIAQYGLDSPSFLIEIKTTDGQISTVKLGNTTFQDDGIYCISDISQRVSVVSKTKQTECEKNILDFASKEIFTLTADDVENITFLRASDDLEMQTYLETAAADSAATQVANMTSGEEGAAIMTSQLTVPLKVEGSADLTALLESMLTLTAAEFLSDDPADTAQYLLVDPEYTLIYKTKSKGEIRVDISKAMGGRYNVMTSLSPLIFSVDTSQYAGIQMPLINMVNTFLTYEMISDVSNIDCTFPEGSFVIDLDVPTGASPSDEESKAYLDGIEAKVTSRNSGGAYISSLYASVACMRMSDFDFDASPENTKDISVIITKRDGTVITVDLAKRDENSYYAFIDGEYQGQLVTVKSIYNDGGTDLYSFGAWTMYEKTKEAMEKAEDGVYLLE